MLNVNCMYESMYEKKLHQCLFHLAVIQSIPLPSTASPVASPTTTTIAITGIVI